MDDILVLSEAITALSGGDLKKKMGILSSAPSSVFLSYCENLRIVQIFILDDVMLNFGGFGLLLR